MKEEAETDGWVVTFEDTASTLAQAIHNGLIEVTDCGVLIVYNGKNRMVACYNDTVWRDVRRVVLKSLDGGLDEPAN